MNRDILTARRTTRDEARPELLAHEGQHSHGRVSTIDAFLNEARRENIAADQQALHDGLLFAVQQLSNVSPSPQWTEGPVEYISTTLCYAKGYFKDCEPVRAASFHELLWQVEQYMSERGPADFYRLMTRFANARWGDIHIVRNASGRYTVMLPRGLRARNRNGRTRPPS